MEAENTGSYSLQQSQAFCTFPFPQMMAEDPNLAVMSEQQTPAEIPAAAPAQEPVQETPRGRKRKPTTTEPKKPVEPKKPAETKKSGKSTKSKEKQEKITDTFKVKRKVDRFNGVSEAELLTKTLPDILTFNLDIVIIGINPGLMAAYKGHHYPGPGNHFWKCLFMSGLSEVQLNHMDDHTLPGKYGIGFTNMVERTTPGSKDLSSKEFREGGRILVEKLQKYQPRIAVFNGKCIYEIFSKEVFGVKVKNLEFGLQPHKIPDTETPSFTLEPYQQYRPATDRHAAYLTGTWPTLVYLGKTVQVRSLLPLKYCVIVPEMPDEAQVHPLDICDHSARIKELESYHDSARCAQFPRAQDKVHYYIKLKDLRDQLKGIERNTDVQEVQYTFDLQMAREDAKKMAVKEEKYDPGYEAAYGGAYNETPCNSEPCSFSSNGLTDNGESTFTDIPNGQWMTQSFTDQIPSFNNHCGTQEREEGNHA